MIGSVPVEGLFLIFYQPLKTIKHLKWILSACLYLDL